MRPFREMEWDVVISLQLYGIYITVMGSMLPSGSTSVADPEVGAAAPPPHPQTKDLIDYKVRIKNKGTPFSKAHCYKVNTFEYLHVAYK